MLISSILLSIVDFLPFTASGDVVETYFIPLVGGLLIGTAAVLMMLALGRIAGISGIVWGAVSGQPEVSWRWLFLVGLPLGAWLFHVTSGAPFPLPSAQPSWVAGVGGLLVGIGVKLGSGCTSGHGVCGIGRLSIRSIVATAVFMATGIATVFILDQFRGAVA